MSDGNASRRRVDGWLSAVRSRIEDSDFDPHEVGLLYEAFRDAYPGVEFPPDLERRSLQLLLIADHSRADLRRRLEEMDDAYVVRDGVAIGSAVPRGPNQAGDDIERSKLVLSEFARLATHSNISFERLKAISGRFGPAYRALSKKAPLCFMHLPKTGGSSVREWLYSMFDQSLVYPGRNTEDFEQDDPGAARYELFAGHIFGSQLKNLPPDIQIFTIVRDPCEVAVSSYHHILAVLNDPHERPDVLELSRLFHKIGLDASLALDTGQTRSIFRDTLLRFYGVPPAQNGTMSGLDAADESLQTMRSAARSSAVSLLEHIDIIGDFHHFEASLLLLAAERAWPAPPVLPRAHDYGAPTNVVARIPSVRERMVASSPVDFELYKMAQDRALVGRQRLESLCGKADADAVNRHHMRHFFQTADRMLGFDMLPGEAWNGSGWIRVYDSEGNPCREIAHESCATTLVLLEQRIGDYEVFAHVWDVAEAFILAALGVSVAGTRLRRMSTEWRSGALTVEWHLPADIVTRLEGKVELCFHKPAGIAVGDLRFARIGCVPLAA